jgi:hypothetical protein
MGPDGDEDEAAPDATGAAPDAAGAAPDDALDPDLRPGEARQGADVGQETRPPEVGQETRPPEDEARVRGRLEQFIPEIVRRTLLAGLGAVFTTEEGIRKLASEIPLPKEVAAFLLQQAGSSKDELLRIFARELRHFLESANLAGELQKLLTSLSFEIRTEVRFIPNDEAVGGVKPDLKRKVTLKRNKDEN